MLVSNIELVTSESEDRLDSELRVLSLSDDMDLCSARGREHQDAE